MSKADIYKKGMHDALDPFGDKLNYVANAVNDTREILDDIIDCIEWNVDNPEELANNLKAKKAKRARPRQFRISIVYMGKENELLADALRKDLNNQKNTCEKVGYSSFTKHAGSLVDYRVYIGNPEKTKEENCQVIYKAYGMLILQMDSSYIVEYDPKHNFTDDSKEKFISYYESVISKTLEKSKAAEKALKSRKKRKQLNLDGSEPKGTYAVMESLTSSIDFWGDKPAWMTFVLGLPSMLITLIAMLCMIPVGIGELAFRETVENLREANFDNKFVADAQRQILEVKLVDLFMREQMQDMYNSTSTESPANKPELEVPCSKHVQKTNPAELDYISSGESSGYSLQNAPSVPVTISQTEHNESSTQNFQTSNKETSSTIKVLEVLTDNDPSCIQIHGKVKEGTAKKGEYCKLINKEDGYIEGMYNILTIGWNGGLMEKPTGHMTKFSLRRI